MSASINYEIVKPKKSLYVMAPSWFETTVNKVFGSLPRVFDESDITKLDVIIAMHNKDDGGFVELKGLIEKHGKIKISVSY